SHNETAGYTGERREVPIHKNAFYELNHLVFNRGARLLKSGEGVGLAFLWTRVTLDFLCFNGLTSMVQPELKNAMAIIRAITKAVIASNHSSRFVTFSVSD